MLDDLISHFLTKNLYGSGGSGGSYDEGFEAGKKQAYDAFWDAYQQNGKRWTYEGLFAGNGWTEEIFRPKYPLTPFNAFRMFWANTMNIDLVQHLTNLGIYSAMKVTSEGTEMFAYSQFTRIGEIDFSQSPSAASAFSGASSLVTIDKLVLGISNNISSMFNNCSSLMHITIEGTINYTMNFQWSPLTVDSMRSIITHLTDYSGDENNIYMRTLTFNEACWTALEASGTSPNGDTWKEYVSDLGWNAV